MESTEELTIEDIVNLKSSCSKKVFDNFIEQKYRNQIKSKQSDGKPAKTKKTKEELEFEKVFGCERNKDGKPTIDKRAFNLDDKESDVDEEDKPDVMSTKYRPRKFREIIKVEENVSFAI